MPVSARTAVGRACALAAAIGLLAWTGTSVAQVARVLETRGAAVVERGGANPRILGQGEPLDQRDTISVARDSWTMLEFSDRTRVTLRPNTVFRIDAYSAGAPESMLMGLVKGGLRAVTGLIGQRRPSSVSVHTALATIGVRGTEFDARLCEDDCAAEERAQPTPRSRMLPVARVIELNGIAAAGGTAYPVRLLAPGVMLHEGEAIATGRGGSIVLVFRDGAQVALAPNSRFAINRFRYDEAAPRDGSAYLSLYAGSLRVTTGQLAKIGPDAFLVRTALGVVRSFGTTWSASGCVGSFCASASVTVDSSGASGEASASGGGGQATATGSVDAGGASGEASVIKPTGGGATPSLGTDRPYPDIAKIPAGPAFYVPAPYPTGPPPVVTEQVQETLAAVRNVITEVASAATDEAKNAQQQASHLGSATRTQAEDKLAQAAAALQDKSAADRKLAEEKLAALKSTVAATAQDTADKLRAYDLTGGMVSVVGPPELVVPPGSLQTLPGEPVVARAGERTITTWVETVVNVVNTTGGGTSNAGKVTRTEVVGPEGTTTTLVFELMFASPMVTGVVPHVGGPLIALGPGKPGTVQVTHRAPDGTTTVSYPGSQDGTAHPSSVAVLEGEVEIVGRGRVRAGELLTSVGGPVRVANLDLPVAPVVRTEPSPFSTDRTIEPGLYVWVRDGVVSVSKDDQAVDVPAGNAAVATKDKLGLLDAVPGFLRFDETPRPTRAAGTAAADVFKQPDGSILNMCVVK